MSLMSFVCVCDSGNSTGCFFRIVEMVEEHLSRSSRDLSRGQCLLVAGRDWCELSGKDEDTSTTECIHGGSIVWSNVDSRSHKESTMCFRFAFSLFLPQAVCQEACQAAGMQLRLQEKVSSPSVVDGQSLFASQIRRSMWRKRFKLVIETKITAKNSFTNFHTHIDPRFQVLNINGYKWFQSASTQYPRRDFFTDQLWNAQRLEMFGESKAENWCLQWRVLWTLFK